MFKKLKALASKVGTAIKSAFTGRKSEPSTMEQKITRKWPDWRKKEFREAMKFGTSRHRNQRGQKGAFGQSRANRERKLMPTTRKEQNRLGWYLPELPDENAKG